MSVSVGSGVSVSAGVDEGVVEAVNVNVAVGEGVIVGVSVLVGVDVRVKVGVAVGVLLGVGVDVSVTKGSISMAMFSSRSRRIHLPSNGCRVLSSWLGAIKSQVYPSLSIFAENSGHTFIL